MTQVFLMDGAGPVDHKLQVLPVKVMIVESDGYQGVIKYVVKLLNPLNTVSARYTGYLSPGLNQKVYTLPVGNLSGLWKVQVLFERGTDDKNEEEYVFELPDQLVSS